MYNVDGLRAGIVNLKRNIKVLEKAIEVERKTISEYKVMIDDIERAEGQKAEAEAGIHIEVIRDDG